MSEWLIDFKGRNPSNAERLNFLWRSDNIYIMDNHRATLWCWLQHINLREKYPLFHIDAHYDACPVSDASWFPTLPELFGISLPDYLGLTFDDDYGGDPMSIIRWDNYLSMFIEKFSKNMNDNFFTATHLKGKAPQDIYV